MSVVTPQSSAPCDLSSRPAAAAVTQACPSGNARRLFRACVLGALLLGASPPRAADTIAADTIAADTGAGVARGREAYLSVGCWQCHGTVGQGGSAGPRLAPGPLPLEALRAFLRNSVRTMPAYPTTILTDAAIDDIHAYLQSLPAPPRADSLPLLRALK